MTEGSRNVLVGMFVVTSLVVMAALMVVFGEAPSWLGGSEWPLRITGVHELRGIGPGGAVTMNGVEVGRIKHLEFVDLARPHRGVVIVTGIKNRFAVPKGAVAKIYGATLGFGQGHIDLFVESGSQAQPIDKKNAFITGKMYSMVGELISKDLIQAFEDTLRNIGDLASAATPVAANLEKMIDYRSLIEVNSGKVKPNLTTAIERIDAFVEHATSILGDESVQSDTKEAIKNLKNAASEISQTALVLSLETQRLSDNLNTNVDRTSEALNESLTGLNRVLENLDTASKSMTHILAQVENGQGSAGRLIRDDRLYEAGVLALDRLSTLIATVQRILGKAEEDGFIKVGKITPVGTFYKDLPVGDFAGRVMEAIAAKQESTRLQQATDQSTD